MKTSVEQIRRELARVLPEGADSVSAKANLFEVGLHSLAVLQLLEPLSKLAGARLDYSDLVQDPSLGAWVRLCQRKDD